MAHVSVEPVIANSIAAGETRRIGVNIGQQRGLVEHG